MATAARITTTDLTWMSMTRRPMRNRVDVVVEVAEGRDHPVELAGGEAFGQADDVLQGERDADGGDQGTRVGELRRGR